MTKINAQINPSTKIVAKTVTLHDVSADSVGLGDVDNTSDINKPISTLTQSALDLKADQSTTYSKVEVDNNIANLVDSAPSTLNTLNELAAALGDEANFATNVANSIATKASQTSLDTHTTDTNNPHSVTATQVGLGDVTNESKVTMFADPTITGDLTVGDIEIGSSSSSTVVDLLDASNGSEARDAIGAINYPYTTDFQSGTEQERNLTSITDTSGYNNNSNLTSIYIGSNVTSIGSSAFDYCTSLTNITITDSVTTIGSSAFYFCTALTSITIPDSVTTIGDSAFSTCDSLTSITLPKNVTTIGSSAFYFCTALTSVNLPDSLTSIESHAFYFCNAMTSVDIGNSVTTIGNHAFYLCENLTSVTIPDSVTSIGSMAFYGIGNLTSVTIGSSVTSIGSYAFYFCDTLTSVTIPDSVTSIGSSGFGYCSDLATINCLATTAPTLGSGWPGVFYNVSATEIHVPAGATGYGTTYGGLTVVADL